MFAGQILYARVYVLDLNPWVFPDGKSTVFLLVVWAAGNVMRLT